MGDNHVDYSKPQLMSSFTDEWPCRSWTFKTLADLLEKNKFSCRVAPKSCDKKMETQCSHHLVTVKEFCDWLDGTANDSNPLSDIAREDNCCYIDYKHIKDMFKEHPHIFDEVRWEDFGLVGLNGYDSTIWLSSEGANTPGHQDTYGFNLITQIYGRKLWILFPPEDSQFLYPTRVPYEESSIFSEVNMRKPDLHSHPQFKLSHPYVVTLQPGQTLYVPRHWWHYVESLEPSISINVWVPMIEDKDSHVSEAITRCLATSLISSLDTSYTGDMQSRWLNPTENLAPTSMNLMLLKASLCQLLEDCHFLMTDNKQDMGGDAVCEHELIEHSSHGLMTDKKQDMGGDSVCEHELIQHSDLSHGLIHSDCSQELNQGGLSHGIIQQGDFQLKQQGGFQLKQQGGFQRNQETETADNSESHSQLMMWDSENRTCQNVQEDASTDAGNVLTSVASTGQSGRASDESMLSLFIEKMKECKTCRADTPFQCDFQVNLSLETEFDPQGPSPKKLKIYPSSTKATYNSEVSTLTETSCSKIISINPCSFDNYLKVLNNLCKHKQCRRCCIDSRTSNCITVSSGDINNSPTHAKVSSSKISQHQSSTTGTASFESANSGNIKCLKDECSAVSDSRKRKTSFDSKDKECGGASGDGSGIEDNSEGDKVSECVHSGSLAAGDSSELSQLEVAEMLLSCTLHPQVVTLISQLFREQYQHRLKQ